MATSSTNRIHVHGAELSTDGDSLGTYLEAIALLVAVVAVLGAAWAVALPRADADLTIPAAPAPAVATFVRGPLDSSDVVQPSVDSSIATAVSSPLAVLGTARLDA